MHPIEAFLTRTHKGHCEYFATACVLLLRAQNIPARVATGFYASDWNPQSQSFTVRQCDAHAWAEVWLDGYGWLTLDPTPPDWRGRGVRQFADGSAWGRWAGALRSTWQLWVLDYSVYQQQQLVAALLNGPWAGKALRLAGPLLETLKHFSLRTASAGAGFKPSGRDRLINALLLLAAVALGALLILQLRTRRAQAVIRSPLRSPVAFMNLLLERLRTLGWKRTQSQTAAELLARIDEETAGRWALQGVLELYHRCRFAQEPLSGEDEARVQEIIRNMK
jgi:hypothetical protein